MFRSELPLNFGWYKKKKNGVNFIHIFISEIKIEQEKWLNELCLNQVKKSKKKTN